MTRINIMLRTLHGKVSLILLALFLATAAFNVFWTLHSVRYQLMSADQRLNRGLADYLVKHEFDEGELADAGKKLEHSFEMLMDINPSIELYLLDPTGQILSYSAPRGHVVRETVAVRPIEVYLSPSDNLPILGDDPRHLWRQKPFSAAVVSMEGLNKGYLYIILGGEEHDSFFDLFTGNSIFRITLLVSLSALLFLFATVFLLFRLATVRHRQLALAMEEFRQSDFSAPVQMTTETKKSGGDEIDLLETVFTEMSERIREQIGELRDKDQLRRELVSNISHDLRTPLASLQGYIETLETKHERLSPTERNEILEKAMRLVSRLGKLVAELLELARLDSLDLVADKEPFPLADLVSDILMDFQEPALRNNIQLSLDINENVSLVNGDIRLLERAIQNVIDNALKFTPENGQVTVSLTSFQDKVRLSVSDTGPGISPEDMPHIFERFYRSGSSISETGIGLGLAISQRIAELHNTVIGVENLPDEGTVFTLDLETWSLAEA
jgi:two-component system OmpR family sensor kinase